MHQQHFPTPDRIMNIFQSKHHKMFSDQEWEVPTTLWTLLMNIIHQSTMLPEEVPPPQWTTSLNSMMITKVRCLDSQIHQERIQLHMLLTRVLSQATILWKFKDHQPYLNSKVFWLRDSEKHLKIEEAEESLVSPDNSKSLMIMVLVILISMNSQKLFKISKFKLKRLILKVCLNPWI